MIFSPPRSIFSIKFFLILLSLIHVAHSVYKALKSRADVKIGHKIAKLKETLKSDSSSIVLVDGDNVRGKTSFTVTKEGLCRDLEAWSRMNSFDGRVCLIYDHGNDHEGFLHESMGVVFSGPSLKADDVIARDVVRLQQSMNSSVIVVTSDSGLKERCIRGARRSNRELSIVDSVMFVEMMGHDLETDPLNTNTIDQPSSTDLSEAPKEARSNSGISGVASSLVSVEAEMERFKDSRANSILKEVSIRNQIRSLERLSNGGCGKKKLAKLKKRTAELENRLKKMIEDSGMSIDSATLIPGARFGGLSADDSESLANALVTAPGVTVARAEQTWERVILAERLRNALRYKKVAALASGGENQAMDVDKASKDDAPGQLSLSESNSEAYAIVCQYVEQINRNFSRMNYTDEVIRFQRGNEAASTNASKVSDETQVPPPTVAPVPASTEEVSDPTSMIAVVGAVSTDSVVNGVPDPVIVPRPQTTSPTSTTLSPLHQSIFEQQQRVVVAPTQTLSRKLSELRAKAGTKAGNCNNVRYTISSEGGRVYRLPLLGSYETTTGSIGTIAATEVAAADITDEDVSSSDRSTADDSELSSPIVGSTANEHNTDTEGVGAGNDNESNGSSTSTSLNPPRRSSRRARGAGINMSKPNGPPAMKIVALSDTHGLERILTDAVPFGDILIHAGDYAKDGGKNREKYQALDLWLSKLPHRHKIVVRGNHDPPGAKFPLSNALYASKPTTVEIEGIKIALAPYGALKAPEGHILVSQVPPYGVLDEPMKKEKHAGSESLLRSVTRMEHKPQLWIFGHIHEAFGAINHPFRMGGKACADTLCVNAGLANPGRAHSLVNLPVTIEVAEVLREDTHPRVSLSSQEEHKEEEHGEEDHEDDLV